MTDKTLAVEAPPERSFGLSKSRIAAFEQCPKRLWLAIHRPELAAPDAQAGTRFAAGHQVGAIACSLHPEGTMVTAEDGLEVALAQTQELMSASAPRPLFEATFQHDGVLVRVDVLEPDGEGGWRIAEVKSSARVKDYHRRDLATQVWVAMQSGVRISSAAIRHIDTAFSLERENDYAGLFRDTELLADLADAIGGRAAVVRAARNALGGSEPAVSPGGHCEKPFACEFASHCGAFVAPGPKWPVTMLPRAGGRRWVEAGVSDLLQIDPADLLDPVHRRIHQATLTGEPFHDVELARSMMQSWAYPRTWLDFETIAFAVPRWLGTRPYQQIPFQFSAHVEREDGSIVHHDFLSLGGEDPRRGCAEALAATLPSTGAVVAYNAAFERACILDLAATFPDLRGKLEALANRVVDLLPVTRACWYHRDQRGSWSIKAVLPTVAPELDYGDLEVGDGQAAQLAYLEATDPATGPERRATLDEALRTYCARDTEAMVRLASHLSGGSL